MKRVFQRKDVVYHYGFGRGTVITINTSPFSSSPYYIKWDNETTPGSWFSEKVLSFESWPAPVHERPFNKGWYVLQLGKDGVYTIEYLTKALDEEVKCIHYFGEKMPKILI